MYCEYGYTRKSTPKQSIDRQIRNIKASFPNAVIIQETYTGTKIDRKEWNKLYRAVKAGDTIIFDSVSRMSRNATEGFEAYEALYNRGVHLIFLKEPHINTDVFKFPTTLECSIHREHTLVGTVHCRPDIHVGGNSQFFTIINPVIF